MNTSTLYHIDSKLIAILLFLGIILFNFIGSGVAKYLRKRYAGFEPVGIGPFEGAMLGLISLLMAFTFNKSASYYDSHREVIVHESNCIGTALHRSDLYPDSIRWAFRNDFKDYIAQRIDYYEAGEDEGKIQVALQKANVISEKIWNRAAVLSQQDNSTTRSMHMIAAVNDMIDAVGLREEARITHVPGSILWLLLTLCLVGSFIVGYASKSKKTDWVVLLIYSIVMVMTIYLILDLDRPRHGLINLRASHESMYNLMNTFEEER